ncbi:MAG: 30S ribosomal protein S6 [Planctomycetes bacterium]|nr:30S ribosomal protein S6 [Planctomycetota bacterium]
MSETTGVATRPQRAEPEQPKEPVLPQLGAELMKTTRLYELVMLFDPAEASRTWDKLEEWVKELVGTKHGQHVLRIDKWADARKLAYEIKGLKRGTYMVVYFRAAPKAVNELDRDLRLDEKVIRHIIVMHEQEPPTVGKTADDFDQAPMRRDDDERGED